MIGLELILCNSVITMQIISIQFQNITYTKVFLKKIGNSKLLDLLYKRILLKIKYFREFFMRCQFIS